MLRKLDVAMGLVHRPTVLFLDEPTTGLDPEARAELWAEIGQLTRDGLTILLTTHYLEEADRLAGQLAIVDRGRIVASGTPDELKAELHGDAILVELHEPAGGARAAASLTGIAGLARAGRRRPLAPCPGDPRGNPRPGRALRARCRRHRGRLDHRRASVARRRLPPPHRAGLPPADRGVLRMTAIAQSVYMTQRHARALYPPAVVPGDHADPADHLAAPVRGALPSVTEIPGFAAGGSYLDYLVPGVVVMTALFSSGWSGMGIIEDMERGLMDRFLVAPMHRSSLIGGRVAYEAISLVLQSLIIAGLALVLGARFDGGPLGFAVLVLSAVLLGASFAAALGRVGARPAPTRVGHRAQLVPGPAADVRVGRVPAAGPGARLDRDAGPDQPGQLGRRGRPGGAAGERRLELHPAATRRAADPGDRLPRAGDPGVPELSALGLTGERAPGRRALRTRPGARPVARCTLGLSYRHPRREDSRCRETSEGRSSRRPGPATRNR